MNKIILSMVSILMGITVTCNDIVDNKFNNIDIKIKDDFKKCCKMNVVYFVDKDILALNYSNIEEYMIDKITELNSSIKYDFVYEGDQGFAYPMYVNKIILNYSNTSGFKVHNKTIYATLERNNYEV